MKRFLKIIGIVLLSLMLIVVVLYLTCTSPVPAVVYFDEPYYRTTQARLDSMAVVAVTDRIHAGFGRVSITPPLNTASEEDAFMKHVPLAGYGGREGKPVTGVHDSIFVSAAAIQIGDKTIVLVTADLLIMPPNVADSVTALVSRYGLERDQLFYSATHTHSSIGAWAPGYIGKMFAGEEDPRVSRWISSRIAEAVGQAMADIRPAKIATGIIPMEKYTRNRLIGPKGTKNNDFAYILLEQPGFRKAVIGSYAAHATTLGEDNFEVSADYPGYWVRKMESTSVDFAFFFAGSVGSQSPVGEGNGFDRAQWIGNALADSLNRHLSRAEPLEDVTLSYLSLRMDLPPFNIRVTADRNLSTAVSRKLLPFPESAYVQAFRLGNMLWITTPCDFSGEFALQLKNSLASRGIQANITSFNGGYVGYIVPGRYFFLDEYEPKVMGWFGPNMGEFTMDMIRQLSRAMTGSDNI